MAILTTSYQKLGEAYLGTDDYGGKMYIRLYAKYSEQNITNNTTTVQYQARAYFDKDWDIFDRQSNGTISGTGANTQSFARSDSYYGGETILGTAEGLVTHNSDGSKSITASTTLIFPNWGWSATASGSADLPTIPRASTIVSVSTANIGSNSTIVVDRKSNSFTHTITYAFGNLSGTIVTKSSNTSISWTIPTSFYAQIPNSKTGNGTLTITTYNGNTQIGSSSTKSFSVSTNENSCKPTISASVVDSNSTTTAITGNNHILIAGYSTASVTYSTTPNNNSSIKRVSVNNAVAYSGTSSSTVSGTKILSNFNNNAIEIETLDSRGYFNTKHLTSGTDYTLIPYIPLTFNGEITRQTPTGSVLLLSFSGNYYNGTLGNTTNSLSLSWKYREKGTSTWSTATSLVLNTDYTITNNTFSSGSGSTQSTITLGSVFDYQKNYEIGIFCSDALISSTVVLTGKKGKPIVNWNNDYFNVNGDLKSQGSVIAELFAPYNYTQSDLTKIQDYIRSGTPLTPEEINKYDVDRNGIVNINDYTAISQYITYGITTTSSAKVKLQNSYRLNRLAISIEDGSGNELVKLNQSGLYIGGSQLIVNASDTVSGGLKVRLSGNTLYITNDGSNP